MKSKILMRILQYSGRQKKYFFFSLVSAIISVISSVIAPLMIGHIVNEMVIPLIFRTSFIGC